MLPVLQAECIELSNQKKVERIIIDKKKTWIVGDTWSGTKRANISEWKR